MPIALRTDFDAALVRKAARCSKDGAQTRRLLALASIYNGASRTDAARIDDHSRRAYAEILPDETRASCLRFLFNALRFFQRHGITVERVMTNNGPVFKSRRYRKPCAGS